MTRPFFLYFILKAFGLTLLPSYMISIFKSVILSGGTFFNAFSYSLSISLYCFRLTFFACETRLSSSGETPKTSAIKCPAWSLSSFPGVFGLYLRRPRCSFNRSSSAEQLDILPSSSVS